MVVSRNKIFNFFYLLLILKVNNSKNINYKGVIYVNYYFKMALKVLAIFFFFAAIK